MFKLINNSVRKFKVKAMQAYLTITSLLFLRATTAFSYSENASVYTTVGPKFSSSKPAEYFIQGLMSMTNGEPCDSITIGGLMRIQAIKYAIKTRKNFTNTNITLGYFIDDTCLSVPITMARGIELANQLRRSTCLKDNPSTCTADNQNKSKLLAVIGAYYSYTTIPLASLLSLYSIPQVSYGASSPLLSKRKEFKSYFRTIPSDEFAVEAMLDVLLYFNWTYIFAVGSKDDYGKLGLTLLKKLAKENNICITGNAYIPFETSETQKIAKEIALKIQSEERATTVIMFNYALGMGEYILEEADKLGLKRIWLTSEAWNPEVLSSTRIPKRQLESIITISLDYGQPLPGFVSYIKNTVKTEFNCDTWLHEYIGQTFHCNVTSRDNDDILHGTKISNINQICSVESSKIINIILEDNPSQINNLIDAVDSVIHAIDIVITARCPSSPCKHDITPAEVTKALQNINFTNRLNKTFSYDDNGNPAFVSYSIEQLQMNDKNKVVYKILGNWKKDKERLIMDIEELKLPDWSKDIPISSCSIDCQPGEEKVGMQGCCWQCQRCSNNTITNTTNQNSCIECPAGFYTKTNTYCVETPIIYLGPETPMGITMITLSVVGLFVTIICAILIFIYKDTEAIQGWSRLFIFSSMFLLIATFAYTTIHMVFPTRTTCRFQAIYFHILLTCYCVMLLIKNNSVVSFISKYVNEKKDKTTSQVLILSVIVACEIALIVAWQFKEIFPVEKYLNDYEYFEQCKVEFKLLRMLAFAFPFLIVVVASIQSLSDRHTTFQYGEAKFLHYTCLLFCITSIAYAVTVNHVFGKYRAMVTLCTTLGYGYVYIGCMIITKIFHAITAPSNSQEGICNIGFQGDTTDPKIEGTRTVSLKKYEQ